MRKVYANADEALAGQIKDGMILMAGGFGLSGVPETLIEAVRKSGAKDLTFRFQQRPASTGLVLAFCLKRARSRR